MTIKECVVHSSCDIIKVKSFLLLTIQQILSSPNQQFNNPIIQQILSSLVRNSTLIMNKRLISLGLIFEEKTFREDKEKERLLELPNI